MCVEKTYKEEYSLKCVFVIPYIWSIKKDGVRTIFDGTILVTTFSIQKGQNNGGNVVIQIFFIPQM
jgi:hypothetical protein